MKPTKPTYEELEQRVKELEDLYVVSKTREEALLMERKEFISIFNTLDAGIYVSDPDNYELLFANDAIHKIADSTNKIIGKKCYQVLQQSDAPCSFCTNSIIFHDRPDKPHIYEFKNPANGRWYHCIDRVIQWIDGRKVRFQMAVDIHKRKTAEEALLESQRNYAALIEQAVDGVVIIQDGLRKFSNKAMADLFGYSLEDLLDKPFEEIVAPEFRGNVKSLLDDVAKGRKSPHTYKSKILRKDGTPRDVEVSISPIQYSGRPAVMGMIRDVTERLVLAENLWESEERYRLLHDYLDVHLPLHLGHSDESYTFRLWNRYSEKMLGYSPEEAIGKLKPSDIHESPEEAREVVQTVEKKGLYDKEINLVHKDGHKVPVRLVVVPKKNPEGNIIGLYGFAEDITERKKAETALKESERRFRALVENSPMGIFICQGEEIVYKNPEQIRIFNSAHNSMSMQEFGRRIHPDDLDKFSPFFDILRGGDTSTLDTDVRFYVNDRSDSQSAMKWVQCRASRINYHGKNLVLVNMMDITRAKQLENVLNVEDKMTSLGRVAAGMAHEIRSPLSGINILFDTLSQVCESQDRIDAKLLEEFRVIIEKVQSASQKIESVVRRVLDFTRPGEVRRHLTNLNQPVEEAVKLSTVTLRKEGIDVQLNLSEDMPMCYVDPRRIEQVLMNLITNAIHAMTENSGQKHLAIETFTEIGVVVIKVADSGPGVPLAFWDKIFDPYFSTKAKGSGIGLSLSRRIIKDHQGTLEVDKSRWNGAEFIIRLPIRSES